MASKTYNVFVIKRTSLNLDVDLVAEARGVLGTRGTTDTVHAALRETVRKQRLQWLLNYDMSLTDEEHDELERDEHEGEWSSLPTRAPGRRVTEA